VDGFTNEDTGTENWSKRWFVLRDNELKYYKSEKITKTTQPQGSIILEGCQVDIAPESKYSKRFCFDLNSPHQNRVYAIMAENGTSLQEWMSAIRRAMLRIRREKSKSDAAARNSKASADFDAETLAAVTGAASKGGGLARDPSPAPNGHDYGGRPGSSSIDGKAKPTSPVSASSSSPPAAAQSSNPSTAGTGTLRGSAAAAEQNLPVDAPPPVASPATRFGGGASKADDNNKFDVYLQWLEEQNKDKGLTRQGSKHGNLHSQLLEEDLPPNAGCCANCKCIIS